ncbi:MAG: 1-phosphofructokinase [Clostridia bacterium]|jgi:1-phosphofructokinase|nr:1-phosphofructokinase [Clostridia bacterium]MCI9085426.1 1-phosphofructokinase [Clostridia bacterium]NDO19784.1 1-phosphofructokinase [Lachnospiraceae bacterium MD329]
MIYTVTFNPAIDYAIGVENLQPGMTNRASYEQLLPGGKGLNVSTILNNLGIENTALGFIAGFTGKEIKRSFEELGGKSDFIELKNGLSRINVKIKSDKETEINAVGPVIDDAAMSELLKKLNILKDGDTLILAGSIPSSLPDSLYSDIMKMLSDRNIMIAVDATKDLLINVLEHKPFLVKPNNHELGEIFSVTLKTRAEVVPYAKKLQEKGAKNVLISMAGEGAVLIAETGDVLMSEAPKGTVKNSVGAGDSMVAGFIAGWYEKRDYTHAFKMGLSAGSASAFSEMLATKSEIERVYNSFELL